MTGEEELVVAKSGPNGIPARSGDTPGSATVELLAFDGTKFTPNETATAFNLDSLPVCPDVWVLLKRINGYWFVSLEDAPDGSTPESQSLPR